MNDVADSLVIVVVIGVVHVVVYQFDDDSMEKDYQ